MTRVKNPVSKADMIHTSSARGIICSRRGAWTLTQIKDAAVRAPMRFARLRETTAPGADPVVDFSLARNRLGLPWK